MTLHIISPQDHPPEGAQIINTTSRSKDWGVGLSPFFLGPCRLYGGHEAKNVENGWQYSKVFEYYLEDDGSVGERYFSWAKRGWQKQRADRYPMGREAKPLFSYWNGETYSYVEARKKIYIKLYSNAVKHTIAFERLQELYNTTKDDLYLWDYDGYDHKTLNLSYEEVLNNPERKMGHAFVLGMMLEGI